MTKSWSIQTVKITLQILYLSTAPASFSGGALKDNFSGILKLSCFPHSTSILLFILNCALLCGLKEFFSTLLFEVPPTLGQAVTAGGTA